MIELTIHGKLLSKSNSRIFTSWGGHPRLIKSPKALQYMESSMWQLKSQLRGHVMFEKVPIYLHADIYYDSKRPDLDPSLLMDVLEKSGVYKNDRQIHELFCRKLYDKINPRCEIKVGVLE